MTRKRLDKCHIKMITNVVDIATGLQAVKLWLRSQERQEIFLASETSRPTLEPMQPPFNWASVFFPGIKQLELEGNHSSPSNAEVKTEWSCTSAVPIHLHGVDRDSFTFTMSN
jgi:hypothetical protein